MEQHLTITAEKGIWLTRYRFGGIDDRSNLLKKEMIPASADIIRRILDAVARYFQKVEIPKDVGDRHISSEKSRHHEKSRIVMQGISGVNERYRRKMIISEKGTYCANSVNYLLIQNNIEYFLGLYNSNVLNWFFAKLSTNSNVNGYEVDNLPVRIPNENTMEQVKNVVLELLKNPSDNNKFDELNDIVYSIYGLNESERKIIELKRV